MKYYHGLRERETGPQPVYVVEEGQRRPLDPRHDLRNHSPDGFQWGYGGSGPAQLALAILADASDDETAMQHYQQFKSDIISQFQSDWMISETVVQSWINEQ